MKSSQLFVTLLISATVWAGGRKRFVLFARVNDTLTPLSEKELGEDYDNSSVLCYGKPWASPVRFKLDRDRTASTRGDMEFLGFEEYGLVFGSSIVGSQLNLTDGRVFNDPFYSCQLHDSKLQQIWQGRKKRPRRGCFRVRLFLLPYDKKNKTAVIGTPAPPGLSVRSERSNPEYYEKYSDLPWVLFANISGNLTPLSSHRSKYNWHVISYGYSWATPAEIFLADGNYAYVRTFTLFNLYFQDSRLVFGPTYEETSLVLDARMRVKNFEFYSCPTNYNLNDITNKKVHDSCFEVEVYLLHYNKTSGYPVLPEENQVTSLSLTRGWKSKKESHVWSGQW